jgi:hypothetical protein
MESATNNSRGSARGEGGRALEGAQAVTEQSELSQEAAISLRGEIQQLKETLNQLNGVGMARTSTPQPQYRAVSEEVAQLRAAITALREQLGECASAKYPTNDELPAEGGMALQQSRDSGKLAMAAKRLRGFGLSLSNKLWQLATTLFGALLGFSQRVFAITVVLLFLYELLVLVPMVGYPGAVKTELGQQIEFVRRFAVGGWQAAMAAENGPLHENGKAAAEADRHKSTSAN